MMFDTFEIIVLSFCAGLITGGLIFYPTAKKLADRVDELEANK